MKKLLFTILIFILVCPAAFTQSINADTLLLIDTNAVAKGKLYYLKISGDTLFLNSDTILSGGGGDSFWYLKSTDTIGANYHIISDSSFVSLWNGSYFGNNGSISGFDTSAYIVTADNENSKSAFAMAAFQLGIPTIQMTAYNGDQGSQVYLEPGYILIATDSLLMNGLLEGDAIYGLGQDADGQIVLTGAGIGDVSDSTWHLTTESSTLKIQPYSEKKEADPYYPYFYADNKVEVVYGYLYNWYAYSDAKNIANEGWRVAVWDDYDDFATYYGDEYDAMFFGYHSFGDKAKDTDMTYWNGENTSDNESRFNARGAGVRNIEGGTFMHFQTRCELWTNLSNQVSLYFEYGSGHVHAESSYAAFGQSIRLVKETTTLSHGQEGLYIGNDGRIYRTICIGSVEWLADNLCETKFRDGTEIPEVTDGETWDDLVTSARCSHGNDEDFSFTGGEDLAPTFINELKLDGILNMTGAAINTFQLFVPTDTEPSPAEEGQVYYDLSEHRIKVYNGTGWKAIKWTDD